ncbi:MULTISPECIES: hypothetical protein [unclassified Aurantimonas]|uniref:hypothetical protein n=1 Tax=unclassified Aurantimonas TaxID=2638230 RepID=UPI002E1758A4|nr:MULTISPECIES: hypothetical protein [unclassified Aurantimonas]MEC5292644.1 hypothetical protein [Aurantimonas sp. C2-3-R2]MEC5413699.1 hypothetical protein [Aurantimonas sp. C2-4-R8]
MIEPVRKVAPIVIETLGDLIDAGMHLSVYCGEALGSHPCGRKLDVDTAELARLFGRDAVYVGRRFPLKCARCCSRKLEYRVGANMMIVPRLGNPFVCR